MEKRFKQNDRRKHPRINKHFILSYYEKDTPEIKHDMSQLKNVSMGGACFLTSHQYEPDTKLIVELKTPYLADTTRLEGTVRGSHEKLPGILYETRLEFDQLTPQSEVVLEKIVKHFKEGEYK